MLVDGDERELGASGLRSGRDDDPVLVEMREADVWMDRTETESATGRVSSLSKKNEKSAAFQWGGSSTEKTMPGRVASRWGDPMAHLLKKNGGQVEEVSRFPAPQNRFGILPGPRWDGKVRGNGFEQKYIDAEGARQDKNEKAYMWSVESM